MLELGECQYATQVFSVTNIDKIVFIYFRVMYVKCHNFLLDVGVQRFVSCTKWSAFAISLTFTVGHITEHLVSVNPSNMVFYSYFKDQKTEIVEFEAVVDSIMVISCLVSNLVELILFFIIIYELVQLHMHRVRINMANTQASKNAITAFGHFISWTVELFLFGMSNYIIVEHKEVLGQTHWIIFMLLPSLNYIFPTVQILTSPDLRHDVFGFMCCTFSKCKCCGRVHEGAADNHDIVMNPPIITVNGPAQVGV